MASDSLTNGLMNGLMNAATPKLGGAKESKTVVRLGVKRLLKTADFENLETTLSIDEEISWSTPEERQQKIAERADVLAGEFQQVQSIVLQKLGLGHQPATFREPPAPKAVAAANPEIFGDDL